jgi:hypothetical protein
MTLPGEIKDLIRKLVLPLTFISFALWTKWWMVYALPVDAPDIIMVGFPLTYAGDGWHTSLSLQIFFLELFIDLLTYFLFWLAVTLLVDRFVVKIRVNKFFSIAFNSIALVCVFGLILVGARLESRFYFMRPYDIEVLDSGYKFYWDGNPRPSNFDYEEYEKKRTGP